MHTGTLAVEPHQTGKGWILPTISTGGACVFRQHCGTVLVSHILTVKEIINS